MFCDKCVTNRMLHSVRVSNIYVLNKEGEHVTPLPYQDKSLQYCS